jgi:hypothetical protein
MVFQCPNCIAITPVKPGFISQVDIQCHQCRAIYRVSTTMLREPPPIAVTSFVEVNRKATGAQA